MFNVRIVAIAAELDSSARTITRRADALGIDVGPDWAGCPAVSAEDARRIVDAERAAKADHKNGWDGFIRACQQWTEARTEAVRAACRAARDAAPRHLSASGADDFARRAATGAGAEYERTTPRPEWDGVAGYGNNARLEYLREDELTPILGRIRHAVRRRGDETGTTDPSEGVAS